MQQSPNQALNLNYLPRDPQLREQLKQAIERSRVRLQKLLLKQTQKDSSSISLMQQLQIKIQKLDLRIKLIDDCAEISLLRLDHLQQIFKHYCTHIFRDGKYMTFDRLQYEKIHLTMDRFFLFMKDFQMNFFVSECNKKQQVIEKSKIATLFKKISSTSRDLTFEQFIRIIEKLAVLYYEEKQLFYQKKQTHRLEKQKRKIQYQKNKKKLMKKRKKQVQEEGENQQQGQQKQENQQENDNEEENDNDKQQEQKNNKKQKNKQKNKKQVKQQKQPQQDKQQNNDLVNDMMNNQDLQDPIQQINKISNRYAFQEQQQQKTPKKPNRLQNVSDQLLLVLTNQQNIQLYYQNIVKIDSVVDYRKKLTDLNLLIFMKGQKGAKTSKSKNKTEVKVQKNTTQQERVRVEQLKKRMEQKKLKERTSPIPKFKDDGAWAKAEEQKKKKRDVKKEREVNAKKKSKQQTDALLQKKMDSQKIHKEKIKQKVSYNENQIDWNMLGKISIDQLKMKQFNPNRYFSKDDQDDKMFLDEYQSGGRPRIMSGMNIRERNSIALVQDMKKRVQQVQKKEKKQSDTLTKRVGQNIPVKSRF